MSSNHTLSLLHFLSVTFVFSTLWRILFSSLAPIALQLVFIFHPLAGMPSNYALSYLCFLSLPFRFSSLWSYYFIPEIMTEPLPALPTLACPTCGRLVQYTCVQSDANGNRGRWLAKCIQTNMQTGQNCNFWRWLPGSRTPSLSPHRPTPTPLLGLAHSIQPPQPLIIPSNAPTTLPKTTCITVGCTMTRIRKTCSHRMCKAHCSEFGDCADPNHRRPMCSTGTLIPSMTFPSPPHPPTVLTSSQASGHTTAGPTFSSHMIPSFTAQLAREEELRENCRWQEATRLESKKKAQQTVLIYAWMEDDVAPAPFEVQDGFVWPHFILNEVVLASAGFSQISTDTRLNLFRFNLGYWTTVKLDHVVDLKDCPHVFIKPLHIRTCQDFNKFLVSTSASAPSPNIRKNLAGERAYVKQRGIAHELSQSMTPSTSKNTHHLSSADDTPSTPKRHRSFVDNTPTRPQVNVLAPAKAKASRRLDLAATRVVKRKMTAARWERESREMYESDSGLEFTDPFPFSTLPSVSESSSSSSTAATASSSSSALIAPISNVVKEEQSTVVLPYLPAVASKKLSWPQDFFAIDITNCFEEYEDTAGQANAHLVFERHFGRWAPFKSSTFSEHRQRWRSASLDVKAAILSAGRTEPGLWVNFMLTTPAPRARIKAARNRKAKELLREDEEVIQILSD